MSCKAVLTVAEVVELLGVMGLAWPQELPSPRGVDWGVSLGVGPLEPPLPLSGLHNHHTTQGVPPWTDHGSSNSVMCHPQCNKADGLAPVKVFEFTDLLTNNSRGFYSTVGS